MKHYNQNLKERVIADYLSGGGTYRQLQGKYGIDFRLIHQWVQAFKDTHTSKKMPSKKENVKPIKDIPKAGGLFLASCSSAEPVSAFIGNAKINCKVELGLKIKCKFVSVITSKKCQLFLGRDNIKTIQQTDSE
jgi:transposase-like protein